MPAPLITIGITAYNAEKTIARAVNSALAQDWPNIEIIVYDDASSDNTIAELQKISDIKIVAGTENKGVAFARNQLIKHANGEFLAFFDDDDESLPQRLQIQYERIIRYEHDKAQSAPVICHAARVQIYPDNTERYEAVPGDDLNVIAPHGPKMAKRILYGAPLKDGFGSMPTCSQMARLTTYKILNGFDADFRRIEDTDFNVRAALAGVHFVGVAEPLVKQTMTRGNEKTLQQEEAMMLQLLAKHRDFIESHTNYAFCRRWIQVKYNYLRGEKLLFARKFLILGLTQPAYTVQRVLWALPNRSHHKTERQFHESEAA